MTAAYCSDVCITPWRWCCASPSRVVHQSRAGLSCKTISEVSLSHEENEVVRLLLLDRRNHLIKDELHSKGTDNNTPVYPREIVRRVLECNAGALIIVHNHPTGDPTPSEEDIINTRELAEILRGIDIYLHDHVIVGRLRAVSMKQLGYL